MTTTAMAPMIRQQVSSPPSEFASRPCWTCRQRRVVCDTRLPHCVKCSKSGRECLGYGDKKPVIWVTGMASRGKMAGRTTFAPNSNSGSNSNSSAKAVAVASAAAPAAPANFGNSLMVKGPMLEPRDEPDMRHLEYCEFSSSRVTCRSAHVARSLVRERN